jgi:hypothetical protein
MGTLLHRGPRRCDAPHPVGGCSWCHSSTFLPEGHSIFQVVLISLCACNFNLHERCSERCNKQHRHAAAAAVARLAPGWLKELLCDRCANEQSKVIFAQVWFLNMFRSNMYLRTPTIFIVTPSRNIVMCSVTTKYIGCYYIQVTSITG